MYAVVNSKRLEELREEKGLSRQDLARAAGISMKTVARVEREEPVRGATTWSWPGSSECILGASRSRTGSQRCRPSWEPLPSTP